MPKSVPPTRFWPRATAMGPATMPRPRRGAGRRPLAHSRLLYAHCLDSSPRPAARPCLPRGRACRGVHALNYFFSPARRVSASDAVSADVAGTADGRVHGSHRAEPRAMRCHVAASASYGPWKRRATSSTSTRRRARMRLASRRPSRVRASASRWCRLPSDGSRRRENLKSGTKIAKEKLF